MAVTIKDVQKALKAHPTVVRRLRRVARFIRKNPKHLQMGLYTNLDGEGEWGSPTCGTTACLVGWYALLGARQAPPESGYSSGEAFMRRGKVVHVMNLLTEDLGLPRTNRWFHRLVSYHSWPKRFKQPYMQTAPEASPEAPDVQRAANIAADRLEYFLETGR